MRQNPIIYSCSGCSIAGQYAYKLALLLDKKGIAEMSCIAGLASGKKYFLKKTTNRNALVIDGCPMQCGKEILNNNKIHAVKHIKLFELGMKKNKEPQYPVDLEKLAEIVVKEF